jgi:hypothetical protein
MATYTLKPLGYQQVAVSDPAGDTFIINPFDQNGNILSEITLDVVSVVGIAQINLPAISSFSNQWSIKINVVGLTAGTNSVDVVADAIDFNFIGSQPKVGLSANGNNVELTIASTRYWSAIVTP